MTPAPIKPASHATGPLFRRTRLLIVSMVVFAAAALAATGLLTLHGLDRIATGHEAAYDSGHAVLEIAHRLRSASNKQAEDARGYLVTGDAAFLARHAQALTEVEAGLAALDATDVPPSLRQEQRALAADFREITSQVLAHARAGRPDAARALVAESGSPLKARWDDRLDALIAHQRDLAEALTADARRTQAETRRALLAVSAMALPLLGLFAWAVLRRLLGPLQAIHATSDGILGLDREDRVLYANAAAGTILGLAPEALIGRAAPEVCRFPTPDGTCQSCPSRKPAGQGPPAISSSLLERPDGSRIAVEYACDGGRASGGALIVRDITARFRAMEAERLEAERQAARGYTEQLLAAHDELAAMVQLLTAQKSELQEAYEAQSRMSAIKDEFLSVVSHELRTPLAAIKNAVAILGKGKAGPLTEDQRRFTTMIREQVERLHRLVDDTLDVSQLENGTMAFRFDRQDLRPLVAEIAGAYQHLLEHEGLSLTLSLGEAPLPVSLDRDRMTQVLLNLLSNAAKFTNPPGQVAVRLVREEDSAVIRVSDTGLGVAQADLERIFEKFTQAEVSLTRRVGGAGLGLAIARDLVEAHGGTIGVESEPGRGSTFWVRLPIAA